MYTELPGSTWDFDLHDAPTPSLTGDCHFLLAVERSQRKLFFAPLKRKSTDVVLEALDDLRIFSAQLFTPQPIISPSPLRLRLHTHQQRKNTSMGTSA